ncbi:hypothetical protein CUMW_062280, partial [Citrus unshiu]
RLSLPSTFLVSPTTQSFPVPIKLESQFCRLKFFPATAKSKTHINDNHHRHTEKHTQSLHHHHSNPTSKERVVFYVLERVLRRKRARKV